MSSRPNLLGFLSILLFLAQPGGSFAQTQDWMTQGNEAYLQKRFSEAAHLYLKATVADPKNADAYYCIGICEYVLGNLDVAEAYLNRAVVLNPQHSLAKSLLQRIADKKGGGKEAQFHRLMREGVQLYRAHRYAEAKADLKQAADLEPGSADAHFNLGLCCLKTKDWAECQDQLYRCLQIDPNNAGARYAMGVLYQKEGYYAQAQQYLSSISQIPQSGAFGTLAINRMSQIQTSLSPNPFHFYGRLQLGYEKNGYNRGTTAIADNEAEYIQGQLSYTPPGINNLLTFAYSLMGYFNEQSQVFGQNYYTNLTASAQPHLSSLLLLPCSFDEALEMDQNLHLEYQHHQLSLAGLYYFQQPSFIQVQAQYLNESYPTYTAYDSQSLLGTVSAWYYLAGGHGLSLAYTLRDTVAQSTVFNYLNNNITGLYTYGGGTKWGLYATYSVQWQAWPNFANTNGSKRNDWIQVATVEGSLPLGTGLNAGLGDTFQQTQSNNSTYSRWSNLTYCDMTLSF